MNEKGLDLVGVRLVPERTLYSTEKILEPEDAFKLLGEELGLCDREVFCVLHLNAKGQPISASITSIGELTSTIVHPREVFKSAVLSSAAALILLHNHPTGDLSASAVDIGTTKLLVSCGELMKIPVIDHLIFHAREFRSMRKNGYEELFRGSVDAMQKLREAEKEMEKIKIKLPKDCAEDYSAFDIRREINGEAVQLPLTKDELKNAFFKQQHIRDKNFVTDFLLSKAEALCTNFEPETKPDDILASWLKSDKMVERIADKMRRRADKYGIRDSEALEQVIRRAMDKKFCRQKAKPLER